MTHYELYCGGVLFLPYSKGPAPLDPESAEAAWRLGLGIVNTNPQSTSAGNMRIAPGKGNAGEPDGKLILGQGDLEVSLDELALASGLYRIAGNPQQGAFAVIASRRIKRGEIFTLKAYAKDGRLMFVWVFVAEHEAMASQPLHVKKLQVMFQAEPVCDLSATCPACTTEMEPDQKHYLCPKCGYRDGCA